MVALYGGIEAGGTHFVCAIGTGPGDIRARTQFPTAAPDETLGKAVAFLLECHQREPLTAIGIGSFGPVDLDRSSPTWGYITSTPKPGWTSTDFAARIRAAIGVPVALDTDVNAAALGEHRWGAARGLDDFIYLTVGTGIGGGGMAGGRLLHGLTHPEMGHTRVPHDWSADPFQGCCPYHGDCLEGLASGPAIERRWGASPETLASDHPAWELEARYLGLAVASYVCVLSPRRVIIGGGVMGCASLLPMVRRNVRELLNGYIQAREILTQTDHYIVPPELGGDAGVLGAIALAMGV